MSHLSCTHKHQSVATKTTKTSRGQDCRVCETKDSRSTSAAVIAAATAGHAAASQGEPAIHMRLPCSTQGRSCCQGRAAAGHLLPTGNDRHHIRPRAWHTNESKKHSSTFMGIPTVGPSGCLKGLLCTSSLLRTEHQTCPHTQQMQGGCTNPKSSNTRGVHTWNLHLLPKPAAALSSLARCACTGLKVMPCAVQPYLLLMCLLLPPMPQPTSTNCVVTMQ